MGLRKLWLDSIDQVEFCMHLKWSNGLVDFHRFVMFHRR